jgi:hypothetical protein
MNVIRLVAIAALALSGVCGAGGAAPPPFELVFDGKHNEALLHEGTFTTSSSWCTSGSAADVSIDDTTLTAVRQFTCTENAGFTAKIWPLSAEHGGNGSWQIVAGTGSLASLRGKGTFTSIRLAGDASDPATITFRSSWKGVADFDDTPPTVRITSAAVRKLERPGGTYNVRVVLLLADSDGGVVSYSLQIVGPKQTLLGLRQGRKTTGSVTSVVRIKPPRPTRTVLIKIDASDAVGNKSSAAKSISLR